MLEISVKIIFILEVFLFELIYNNSLFANFKKKIFSAFVSIFELQIFWNEFLFVASFYNFYFTFECDDLKLGLK